MERRAAALKGNARRRVWQEVRLVACTASAALQVSRRLHRDMMEEGGSADKEARDQEPLLFDFVILDEAAAMLEPDAVGCLLHGAKVRPAYLPAAHIHAPLRRRGMPCPSCVVTHHRPRAILAGAGVLVLTNVRPPPAGPASLPCPPRRRPHCSWVISSSSRPFRSGRTPTPRDTRSRS